MTGRFAGKVAARLDRLPLTRALWRLVILISLGGAFEFYDLLMTAYLAPGLIVIFNGIITAGTGGSGVAIGHISGGGGLTPATLTGDTSYTGPTPVSGPPPPPSVP